LKLISVVEKGCSSAQSPLAGDTEIDIGFCCVFEMNVDLMLEIWKKDEKVAKREDGEEIQNNSVRQTREDAGKVQPRH
jgi:hypothetical protein